MIVIALLLLIAAAALVVFVVVTGSTGEVPLTWDQLNMGFFPSPLVLFLLGALTMLLALVAVGLIRSGSKRQAEKRRELKRLRKIEEERAAAPHESRGRGEQGRPTGTGTTHSTGTGQTGSSVDPARPGEIRLDEPTHQRRGPGNDAR